MPPLDAQDLDSIPGTPLTNAQAVGTLPMAPTEDQAPLPPVQRDQAVATPAPAKPAITLDSIRQKYPQYSDLSDQQLAQGLHRKFYDDMPFEEFAGRIGYQQPPGLLQRAGRAIGRMATALPSEAAGTAPEAIAAPALTEPVGKVLSTARDAFGSEALGLTDKTAAALQRAGVFPDPNGGLQPLKQINEAIVRPVAAMADAFARAVGSGVVAAQQAAIEAGMALGLTDMQARTIASMPEAFLGSPGEMHVPTRPGGYGADVRSLREEAMNPAGWINRDWEGNREPWHDYQPPRLALPSPEGKRAAPAGGESPAPQSGLSEPRPEAAAPPATEKPVTRQPQRWEDVALQELEPHEQTETAKGAVKDFAEAAKSEGVELPTVTVTAHPTAPTEAPAAATAQPAPEPVPGNRGVSQNPEPEAAPGIAPPQTAAPTEAEPEAPAVPVPAAAPPITAGNRRKPREQAPAAAPEAPPVEQPAPAETPEKPAKSPEINQTEAETGVPGKPPISRNAEPTPFDKVPREPKRLIDFLRQPTVLGEGINQTIIPGGIRDPGGDLRAILGGVRGRPGLINSKGRSFNDALTHAWENGYFPEFERYGYAPGDDQLLKDRIEQDHNGHPVYSEHDLDAVHEYQAALANNDEINRLATEHGIPTHGLTRDQFFDQVHDRMSTEELARDLAERDASDAAEYRAITTDAQRSMDAKSEREVYGQSQARTLEDLEREYQQAGIAPEAEQHAAALEGDRRGAGTAAAGEEAGRSDRRATGTAGRGEAEAAFGRRLPKPQVGGAPLLGEAPPAPREERPAEPTVRNDPRQLNILGTDASARQAQAARDAQGNLRGKGQQQLADEGLFAPKKPDQGGLFGRRAPLYSAVARAVDNLKQARGTGSQMLAQITKTPGVKPEEVRWLGLADWLNPQKSVTREQIAEYVRANALDVQEVEKGAEPDVTAAHEVATQAETELRNALPGYVDVGGVRMGAGEVISRIADGDLLIRNLPEEYQRPAWRFYSALDEMREAQRGSGTGTKYGSYTLSGGENYRELLLTLPGDTRAKEAATDLAMARRAQADAMAHYKRMVEQYGQGHLATADARHAWLDAATHIDRLEAIAKKQPTPYQSSHWDEPNVLAHIRFNERTAPDGKRVLLVEEVQSDWHQQGRKKGYQGAPEKEPTDKEVREYFDLRPGADPADYRQEMMERESHRANRVPDAPFKTTWPQLAMKRVIKWAADNGFDRVAWVPGDVQAARYDLSKQISALDYQRNADGTFKLSFQKDHRGHMIGEAIAPEKLEDHVGKDVAQKIIDGAGDKQNFAANNEPRNEWNRLSGLDLKVGGEGMRGFYDKMLPNEVQKIVGKFGAKVGKSDVGVAYEKRDTVRPDEIAQREHRDQWQRLVEHRRDAEREAQEQGTFGASPRIEQIDREMDALHSRMVDETMARGAAQPVHSVDLTPALRQAVQIEGLPLFKRDRTHGTGQLPSPEAVHAAADAIHRMLGGRARVEVHAAGDGGFEITHDGQTFTADGYAVGRLMRVALSPDKTFHYLNHEALHVLRNMGVFTPAEWRTLEQAAIREGWGKTYDTDRIYADLNPEQRIEEAIAERFADLGTNPRGATPLLMRLLNKLRQWFERFRNLLAGNGLRSAEDVFGKAMRGEVGAREPGSGMPERGHTDVTEAAREAGAFHPAMQFGRREQVVAKLRQTLGMEVAKPEFDVLRDKKGIANAIAGMKAGFAPTSLRGAKPMEYALRQHNANIAQSYDQAVHALEKVRRATDTLSKEAQIAFTDLIEKGERQPTPGLQAVADALRGQLDKEMRATQALGKGYLANAIENYMGHIWGNYHEWAARQESEATQGQMEQIARAMTGAKRPLEGKASFLKKRYFPTQKEGIDQGLIPVTYNPVDLQLIKIYEMQKFRHAVTLAEQMKGQGIARWVKNNPGDEADARIAGLVKLDDKIFKPKFFSEAIQTPSRGIGDNQGPDASTMPGWVEPGSYWAPEPMARVFNNYMSQGWHGKSSLYDGFRAMNNGLNSLQLGLSGFHAMFVALDTALSKSALGLQQMSRGHILRGAASMAETPIAPITTFLKGKAATKAWLEPENATPEMRKIIDAMKAGGARLSMPEFYRTSASGSFFRHLGDFKHPQSVLHDVAQMWRDTPGPLGKAVMVPLRFVGRVLDTIQQPLMGFLVPRMKMGVFADLAQDWLRDHPTASAEEVSAAMTKFQDSVDNRLGQLNYDNLFWDKRLKDLAFVTTRSVGWNLGTIREIAGAAPDAAAFLRDLADGKKPEVTTRMAYAIMLPIIIGTVGAIITYLATGEGPKHTDQDLPGGIPLDLFYPRTGGTTPNGEPERSSIPSYMKDVVAAFKDLPQTVRNKIAPLWATLDELVVQNKDYYGGSIYDPERDSSRVGAYADYLLNQIAPFSVRAKNRLADEQASWEQQALGFFGWQPAPKSITNPERGEAFQRRANTKAYRQRLKEPGRIQFFNAPRAP